MVSLCVCLCVANMISCEVDRCGVTTETVDMELDVDGVDGLRELG
jgi:hypothetical protein